MPNIETLAWFALYRGAYARVAKRLKTDPSYVSRVARGERISPRIQRALFAELAHIERRKPK